MNMKKALLSLCVSACVLVGCSDSQPSPTSDVSTNANQQTDPHDHSDDSHADASQDAHGHPDHGPHDGELIELGNEAFHAEVVHDEAEVAIYVLDSSATKAEAIEAGSLTLSLKHDGQVKQFDLAASADSDDPPGKASRFISSDATLRDWLNHEAEGALTIQIQGKSYTGNLAHDHDHDH